MELSEEHRTMLNEESAISEKVIEARGYRTVEKKADLKRLGFSDAQCNTPGILIPVFAPTGQKVLYQYRPDESRIKDGKPVKYETPSGSRMVLDVHPFAREKLGNPSRPLFITEGLKKGDALVSRGLCAIAVLGVWNWRGTNERGGKVALAEWEYVALNDRRLYVVFDSDIMLKPQVHQALVRLKEFLETRGADVAIIYLPHGEGGAKQGVDDFLVSGHTVEAFLTLATTELREPPMGGDEKDEPGSQSALLVRYAEEAAIFHTPDGEAYVSIPVED